MLYFFSNVDVIWIPTKAGVLVGASLNTNIPLTAGQAQVRAFINGAAANALNLNPLIKSTGPTTNHYVSYAAPVAFAAGDLIDMRYTTDAAFAALNNRLMAFLHVQY